MLREFRQIEKKHHDVVTKVKKKRKTADTVSSWRVKHERRALVVLVLRCRKYLGQRSRPRGSEKRTSVGCPRSRVFLPSGLRVSVFGRNLSEHGAD